MKKKRIIGVILVLFIVLGVLFYFLFSKKNYTEDYLDLVNQGIKEDKYGISKRLDIDLNRISFVNENYIIYSVNGQYFAVDYSMNKVLENASSISYNEDDDCYIVEKGSKKTVYCQGLLSSNILFSIGDNSRLVENDTLDNKVFYLVIENNKKKIYNPEYINGYEIKDYTSINVFDNYVILDKKLIDTKSGESIDIHKLYNVNNKYFILKGEKVYLYNLAEHKMEEYNKLEKKNGYYILDEKYLAIDGEWLDASTKDKRRITDTYYIDYSGCKNGFQLYKNNKKVNSTCYQSVKRINNKVLIGNAEDDTKIVIYDNNKFLETKGRFDVFASLIVELGVGKNEYYNESGTIKNSCKNEVSTNGLNSYICSSGDTKYFMDESFKKISDDYDDIQCYHPGVCIVKKGNYYGLSNGEKLLTEVNYPNLTYIYDGVFFVDRKVKNELLVLNNKDILEKIKYEEFKIDLDVEKIVKDYNLSSIKTFIDKDKEMFKRYAYTVLNNNSFKEYRRQILMYFKVIEQNKKFLNEKNFLENLKELEIIVKSKLAVAGAAGLYYDSEAPRIEMIKNRDYIFYHEFMHFVDHKIDNQDEYIYNRTCRINDKYYDSYKAEADKCTYEDISHGSFMLESGAESNVVRYFKLGALAYNDGVLIYNAMAYLIGEEKMSDIYYSNNTEELLFLELNKYGISLKAYNDFLNSINKWTSIQTKGILKDKADAINFLTDFYYKKNGKSWSNDKKFSLFMKLLINWSNYYDYTQGVNLTKEEKEVVKNNISYNNFVKRINKAYTSTTGEAALILADGKYYLEITGFINRKAYNIVAEYDIEADKIVNYTETLMES